MASLKVPPSRDAQKVAGLLDLPEIVDLIDDLQLTRWTGRPGYPIRAMVGMALVKAVYALPTWTRTARLVAEHAALREAVGGVAPSVYACYRFATKLRENGDALDSCIASVLARLHELLPDLGVDIAVDGSDLPAYANGMRRKANGQPREHYSDPDATWGHRSAISTRKGGGYYGYKVHAAVCTRTGLPVAWRLRTASESEYESVEPLLDSALGRGFKPETCALDKGYDGSAVYAACEGRGVRPIIPLKLTGAVVKGLHSPPTCEHGAWTFAGSDAKRGASKWRCPTAACAPASCWIKADRLHTLIPRTTSRWKDLYRHRVMVERTFGELKHDWALLPLRVRRLDRVALHVDLTILSRLGHALTATKASTTLAVA